jgi:uncharacterized protein (DUF983 family)
MRCHKPAYLAHKLKAGFRLRCPHCEHGRLFDRWFHMREVCPYCQSRFERSSGDGIGGIYINVALAELIAIAGFFAIHELFSPPIMLQLAFWLPFILVFTLLFYPYARGLWTAILYLTGGIYPDPDYDCEYIAPAEILAGRPSLENE